MKKDMVDMKKERNGLRRMGSGGKPEDNYSDVVKEYRSMLQRFMQSCRCW